MIGNHYFFLLEKIFFYFAKIKSLLYTIFLPSEHPIVMGYWQGQTIK